MKNLQNNFTTPEQSKRLLELGVPEDSADCYLTRFGIDEDWEVKVLKNVKYSEITISNQKYCLPCWSVGRLISLCKVCEPKKDYEQLCDELKNCENYCVLIISHIIANLPIIDFSKLED